MSTQIEAIKRWVEVFDGNWHDEPVDSEWADRAHQALAEMRQAIAEAEQPAQQEPVKLSGYELDGRRYKTMEERLKDAFYEGFTSSATYNDIELNDVDEEWLKYAEAHGITKGNT